jgi:hypothetical protein
MTDGNGTDESWRLDLADDDLDVWQGSDPDDPHSLVDLINRVLDKGVVITGDVTISVAGVDLVYLGLNAILTSVSTARRSLGRPVGRGDAGG